MKVSARSSSALSSSALSSSALSSPRSPVSRRALLAAITVGLSFAGRASSAHAEAKVVEPPIEVTAKLVEIPSKFPPDDLYDYAYVMRYEVIGGPLDKKSLLVAHYKPRLPRAKITDSMKAQVSGKVRSFRTGDVHKLKLSPSLKTIWQGALVDEFAATDHKSVRYWALSADPA